MKPTVSLVDGETMINSREEYIICSAVYYNNGETYEHQPKNVDVGIVIAGRRHHNALVTTHLLDPTLKEKSTVTQGFLTSEDRFVDRKVARKIAYKAGQVSVLTDADGRVKRLLSEDIY